MCTSVHMSIHRVMGVNVRSMCIPWFVCSIGGICFFRNIDSKREWFKAQWLKVEPKQSTLFFKLFISFSIIEEMHAIGKLDGEATLAWQTCVSKLFFKDLFYLSKLLNLLKSNQFCFSKIHSLLK